MGYLPPGNINLTVVQMSVGKSEQRWKEFIGFAAFMEFVYCSGCLYGMEKLLQQDQLIVYLDWSAVIIFLLLGMFTILHKSESHPNSLADVRKGVLVAIFNPLQVPFWMIWGVYVFQNNLVKSEIVSIVLFSSICSMGTVVVLWIYSVMGKKLVQKLNMNRLMLNRFIGSLLIFLAVTQALKNLSC